MVKLVLAVAVVAFGALGVGCAAESSPSADDFVIQHSVQQGEGDCAETPEGCSNDATEGSEPTQPPTTLTLENGNAAPVALRELADR